MTLARWIVALALVSIASGSAVALFLAALDHVTAVRHATPALLWLLPAAGAVVSLAYIAAGSGVERGTNLIIDEIHQPGGGVPARLAPLVLLGTLVTHLFGGSAGREGTAVQMGGSIASAVDHHLFRRIRAWPSLQPGERATLLQAGIAAGFGAVFGTPLAGAVFAIEVLHVGALRYRALLPCLVASLLADQLTLAWGVRHTIYPAIAGGRAIFDAASLPNLVMAAIIFGLASRLFSTGSHVLAAWWSRVIRIPWLRSAVGGICIIALTTLVGSRDYLGLGVTSPDPQAVTILSAFHEGGAEPWSWLLKMLFTIVTIASGFKGGEVTPLFFIGATLGNALAVLLQAPVELFAAMGFVAVFAGATNTPIACAIMGVELFGIGAAPYLAAACAIAYVVSGPTGVYSAQRRRGEHAARTAPPA